MVTHQGHPRAKWTDRSALPARVSGVKSPDTGQAEALIGAAATATIRPMRSDALRNRERILAAAGQVFEGKGLEASVADVARAAGVGMGTLYRHFPSKEALVEALVTDVLETTITLARDAAARPDGTGLEHFLAQASAYQAEHLGCLPKLWITDHHLVQSARGLIAELLADAQAHGRVRPDLRSTDISLALWSIRGVLETTGPNAPEAWRRHLDLLIAGMRPAGAELARRPLSQNQVDRILSRHEAPAGAAPARASR
jgi:AcrR family transcriptional regulator